MKVQIPKCALNEDSESLVVQTAADLKAEAIKTMFLVYEETCFEPLPTASKSA